MGVEAKGTGVGSPIARYLQPFELERKSLRSLTATVDRPDGSRFLTSEASTGDVAGAVVVPAYGQIESDAPAPIVFVGDGQSIEGLDLDGAYAVMLPGADQQATRGGLAALNGAGVAAALLASAPAAAALQPQATRAFAAGRLALPEMER